MSEARVEAAEALKRWSVRVRPADRRPYEILFGLSLPTEPLRSAHTEDGSALWLGPDEWLVLMPAGRAVEFQRRQGEFDWATAPPASIVEVTHRSVGIAVSGAGAPWILNAGCPLDLSSRAFPPGACTRTLLGKAEIVLWRLHEPGFRYHLECWRSFAPYVWARLARAAAEGEPLDSRTHHGVKQ
jgi:sarcosine oxidase subunit gamma